MADKEPRRRKKKRDNQRKDDMRSDEPILISQKSDSKDSDQELEEELVLPSHQPSQFAKVVFILLFSGLIVSMGIVFFGLQGAEKGPVDLFEDAHVEEHTETPIDVDEVHSSTDDSHEESEGIFPFDFPGIKSTDTSEPEQAVEKQSFTEELHTPLSFDQTSEEEMIQEVDTSDKADTLTQSDEAANQGDVVLPQSEDVVDQSEDVVDQSEDIVDQSEDEEQPVPEADEHELPVVEDLSKDLPLVETYTEAAVVDDDDADELSPLEPDTIDLVTEEPVVINAPVTESPLLRSEDDISVHFDDQKRTITEDPIVDTSPSDSLENPIDDFLYYENAAITNQEDYLIHEELDNINRVLSKSPDKALKMCEEQLRLHPNSPRLHFMTSQALDRLAESQKSNKYLEEAIAAYQKVLSLKQIPEKLYIMTGTRAVERMRFRGFLGKSVKLLFEMSEKFPKNSDIKNQLAVGYLTIGQNKESKKILLEALKLTPNSGFAKVHLGFILKTDELNYNDAIPLLAEGIATKEQGVIDGRFYFHLGDALYRLGRQDEAMKVYEDGVKEGLFLSAYQRSLYNVNTLTGKPWWDPEKTVYSGFIKILERNWITIKNEALPLIDAKSSGFMPETENLQDKGDWKQFELFARGRKIEKNCLKTPKTCALIEQIPDASGCKRGQVKFSIMHPATHVWAHTGPTNCRLRAHLGLVIPDGASIRVANETRKWTEGKVILFDDSFEHEVWHNGTTFRLVLIVDFWHPELTAYEKRSLSPI